jgi:hypothetical protein
VSSASAEDTFLEEQTSQASSAKILKNLRHLRQKILFFWFDSYLIKEIYTKKFVYLA